MAEKKKPLGGGGDTGEGGKTRADETLREGGKPEAGETLGEAVVFLDRDGTMNREVNYLHRPEDLELIPGTGEAVGLLNRAGYRVIVVTNQAGVARGYYTEEAVEALHRYMNSLLEQEGGHIDAFYYCPHHPEHGIGKYKRSCRCRKPGVGMFEEAERRLADGIDKSRSFMIGDKLLDTEAGHHFGVRSILVGTGYGESIRKEQRAAGKLTEDGRCLDGSYDYFAEDLLSAARMIVNGQIPGCEGPEGGVERGMKGWAEGNTETSAAAGHAWE